MINLRPWTPNDAEFVVTLRNSPELMRWYRQNSPLVVVEQKAFIESNPNVKIIQYLGNPIGVLWIKDTKELSLVLPKEYYGFLGLLCKHMQGVWGEVFVSNPMLPELLNAGFRAVSVKEKAYEKKDYGWQDIVRVEK